MLEGTLVATLLFVSQMRIFSVLWRHRRRLMLRSEHAGLVLGNAHRSCTAVVVSSRLSRGHANHLIRASSIPTSTSSASHRKARFFLGRRRRRSMAVRCVDDCSLFSFPAKGHGLQLSPLTRPHPNRYHYTSRAGLHEPPVERARYCARI